MSYQEMARFGHVVVCDLCEAVGAIGDRDWREMRRDATGAPLHVCRKCRKEAVWCQVHQQYHRANELHRRPCIMCGGLYTAAITRDTNYCPSCARAALPPQPGAARGVQPARREQASVLHQLLIDLQHLFTEPWTSGRGRAG